MSFGIKYRLRVMPYFGKRSLRALALLCERLGIEITEEIDESLLKIIEEEYKRIKI